MPGKRKKGGNFEREICRELSLWWTKGRTDDIFWRTSQSGGRATTRSQKGKETYGQYGDVAAVHPSGRPLLRLATIEIKNGYEKESGFNTLDRPGEKGRTQWDGWISKVKREAKLAGSLSWLLIHRRKGRKTMIYFPLDVARATELDCKLTDSYMKFVLRGRTVFCCPLKTFLALVDPTWIRLFFKKPKVVRIKA